ncbi:solute carrier family 35 member F6 [Condylostylus longicornis]|uniref:solute carrier family 35 member F6 n=1 Tax=Condylostylus longicornis TaxID=2530218 RepID=UPI00244DE58F|nr:solute carrier family 35 member F6 [Condylostylus longicornis]XP_055387644.1 solute carrier family 35 member F6 [Condylostylus longicornis]
MVDVQQFLPLISISCGVLNVLILKWSDILEAEDVSGIKRRFYHPFLQVIIMFLGQILCLVVYKALFIILRRRGDNSENLNFLTSGNRNFSPSIFILPSLCDMVASTMLLIALNFTNASSWQILRSASLIFVSLFGVIYLSQSLKIYHWIGISMVIICVIIVILTDTVNPVLYDSKAVLTSDLLVICSQIFQALQNVYDEKYVKSLDITPIQAVGWQGVFGFLQSLFLLIPLHFIKIDPPFNNNSNGSMEFLPDAFHQFFNSGTLILAHLIFLLSVALHNYAAVAILKSTSSSNRVIIDIFRILPIYLISVLIEREMLGVSTVIAFLILLSGIFTYKNIVFSQIYVWFLRKLTRRRYEDIENEENVISSPADSADI